MALRRYVYSFVLAAMTAGIQQSWAGPVEDAKAAYDAKKFTETMTLARPAAQAGDPTAAYLVGRLNAFGEGTRINPVEAIRWYRIAAEKGHPAAMAQLSGHYRDGYGIEKDTKAAEIWTEKAAAAYRAAGEKGDAEAQYYFAGRLAAGNGVKQDKAEALKWYVRAAEGGSWRAQSYLASNYKYGWITQKDEAEAARWREKAIVSCKAAARQGDVAAASCLASKYDIYSKDPREKAEALSATQQAAEMGECSQIHSMVLQTKRESAERAANWYRRGIEAGCAHHSDLAELYEKGGPGLNIDAREAQRWYEKAFERSRERAEWGGYFNQYEVGKHYEQGKAVPRDYTEAYKWYALAAAGGSMDGKRALEALEPKMTKEQVAEGQKRASAFKKRLKAD